MRRQKAVTILGPEGTRDLGKVFMLTEMPAEQAEKWAARALSAAARSGVDLPSEVVGLGMAGVAILGIRALLSMPFGEMAPLMDEMFECVRIQTDPRVPQGRPLVRAGPSGEGADIEEVATRLQLRQEVFDLHVGFSTAGAIRTWMSSLTPAPTGSSDMPTSDPSAGPSSPQGEPS